ncbi:patatin-like phospholipase family protein [Actinosynnema mirum]|uniref:Patatin n=1 Tax=Actinosynnema mirum (strain ATCC 29888 / DSM 43827 / JCM 3225 / NBRC 14064 / NCIMB 13271 / NRRL B-12336 / IMRU 3971 / 101) TaxID=446462 RepID=C6WEQ9_ACTMD|nr:patatin-like phospholipase family protein [Actinosynnema mirum]ACU39684.1 Patatin [Actinosynnema mirum DSM 43827]
MAAGDGDYGDYEDFDRCCDLTMRGGATSGIVYPLAVVELSKHYRFRSLGGASAGAIGASFAAAAERGRDSGGFDRLADTVTWFASGRQRLAQLFQPTRATRKLYRLVTATMQSRETTGRSAAVSLVFALLGAIGPRAKAALAAALLVWLAGPALWFGAVAWPGFPTWGLAAVVVVAAVTVPWVAVKALPTGRGPLPARIGLLLLAAVPLYPIVPRLRVDWAVLASAATAGVVWLVLGFGLASAVVLIYAGGVRRFVRERAVSIGFGLVPGTGGYRASWWDRRCGMPKSTDVPPLSDWLADSLDHLSGVRGLRFSDLTTNLVLMSTDVSEGRPCRLPFTSDDRWLFCADCLAGVLPARVVDLLGDEGADDKRCPLHPATALRVLPADLPVALAVRMSIPMPGLISAVPLVRAEPEPRVHWFSDGGITSNFPIHFFDTLLPRWPTFGLTLQGYPAPGVQDVWLPEQDASQEGRPWRSVTGAVGFAQAVLDTALGWRDAMQSALPGFRGRIAHVRLRGGEGGTNLFMRPETIRALAERGRVAGELLRTRFTQEGGERTARYRWIRMRIAMREYQELARQARERGEQYRELADGYPVPEELKSWFADPPAGTDPFSADVRLTLDQLGGLVPGPFDGAPPVNPDLRLNPAE